jgi:hypothetical protein
LVENKRKRAFETDFEKLAKKLQSWFYLEDLDAFRVILASVLSFKITDTQPVWLFLIAPPSGGKTELLSLLKEISFVELFGSPLSLSLELGFDRFDRKILVFHDFTQVFFSSKQKRKKIFEWLRELYHDKDHRIGLIAGCTDEIDRHPPLFRALDDSFLQIRLVLEDQEKLAKRVIENSDGEALKMREEFPALVRDFVEECIKFSDTDRLHSKKKFGKLMGQTLLCVLARRLLQYEPVGKFLFWEKRSSERLLQHLYSLLQALCIIDQTLSTTEKHWKLFNRLMLDGVPRFTEPRLQTFLMTCFEGIEEHPYFAEKLTVFGSTQ